MKEFSDLVVHWVASSAVLVWVVPFLHSNSVAFCLMFVNFVHACRDFFFLIIHFNWRKFQNTKFCFRVLFQLPVSAADFFPFYILHYSLYTFISPPQFFTWKMQDLVTASYNLICWFLQLNVALVFSFLHWNRMCVSICVSQFIFRS